MRRMSLIAGFIFCLALVGCGEDTSALPPPVTVSGTLATVHDDDQGSVFIRPDDESSGQPNTTMAELMRKKAEWQRKFPAKKVISVSVVSAPKGGSTSGTMSTILGFFIHYEKQ